MSTLVYQVETAPAPALTVPMTTKPDWEPGDPLYTNPAALTGVNADRNVARPIFELISEYPEKLYFDDAPAPVRCCVHCSVLWAGSPHCWSCDRYTRPPRNDWDWGNFIVRCVTE